MISFFLFFFTMEETEASEMREKNLDVIGSVTKDDFEVTLKVNWEELGERQTLYPVWLDGGNKIPHRGKPKEGVKYFF